MSLVWMSFWGVIYVDVLGACNVRGRHFWTSLVCWGVLNAGITLRCHLCRRYSGVSIKHISFWDIFDADVILGYHVCVRHFGALLLNKSFSWFHVSQRHFGVPIVQKSFLCVIVVDIIL